jgi:hypothetical protein
MLQTFRLEHLKWLRTGSPDFLYLGFATELSFHLILIISSHPKKRVVLNVQHVHRFEPPKIATVELIEYVTNHIGKQHTLLSSYGKDKLLYKTP